MDTNQSVSPTFIPSDEPQWVNHWGVWVNTNEPTTGVISVNSLEWIHDEVSYNPVTNLSYDAYLEYGLAEKIAAWQNAQDDITANPSEDDISQWTDELAEVYEENGDTYLIGSWRFDENSRQWEVYRDDSLDDESAYAAIVDYDFAGGIVQVIWSRFVSRGALCSPCCIGQVDLDNEGEFLGYDLPLSFYGDSRENKSPIMRYWHTSEDEGGSARLEV